VRTPGTVITWATDALQSLPSLTTRAPTLRSSCRMPPKKSRLKNEAHKEFTSYWMLVYLHSVINVT
jgi:hypothetical protein